MQKTHFLIATVFVKMKIIMSLNFANIGYFVKSSKTEYRPDFIQTKVEPSESKWEVTPWFLHYKGLTCSARHLRQGFLSAVDICFREEGERGKKLEDKCN